MTPITEIKGKCQHPGCDKPATLIVVPPYEEYPSSKVRVMCEEHGRRYADAQAVEYGFQCANCGCRSGH